MPVGSLKSAPHDRRVYGVIPHWAFIPIVDTRNSVADT